MPIIGFLLFTSPVTIPFLVLLILGLIYRSKNKKLSTTVLIIGVAYLIVGGGACLTMLVGLANHGAVYPEPTKLKFIAKVKFQDGTKSYEYGHRGSRYEINVIDGNDTVFIDNLFKADSVTFSRINNQLVLFSNNEEIRDLEMYTINRKNPQQNGKIALPPLYIDTTNSIMISYFKQGLEKDDDLVISSTMGRHVSFNVIRFTDLLDYKTSSLNMDDKIWPNFPEGYTLQIKNNELIVENGKKKWKYDVQQQLDQLKY